MSDVHFDHSEAVGKLQELTDDTVKRQNALNQQVPPFPRAAAGRDSSGYARSIQSTLARIHQRRNSQLHNIVRSAAVAIADYGVARTTDEDSAATLNQCDIGDGTRAHYPPLQPEN